MPNDLPPARPRGPSQTVGSGRAAQRVQDARQARFRRRRVLAAALIVVVVAVFVAGTVVALGVAAHQFGSGAAAAGLPGASAAAPSGGSPTAGSSADPSVAATAPPTSTATASSSPTAPAAPLASPAPPAFDKSANSIDDPNSIWVVVNKQRPIADGADFVPPNLADLPSDMPDPFGYMMRADAADALHAMFAADKAEVGTQLIAQSGYRDYEVQVRAYNGYVSSLGVAGADQTSARPGFSEHQTGLAMDILDTSSGCDLETPCFGNSPSGQWLAANAYRFGYILRYPADKTAVTGYEYEPWHFRYIGPALAAEMRATNTTTLEEFFALPTAPDYAP